MGASQPVAQKEFTGMSESEVSTSPLFKTRDNDRGVRALARVLWESWTWSVRSNASASLERILPT